MFPSKMAAEWRERLKDPKFAEAHLGVADTYGLMAVDGYAPPTEAWPRCDEESRKALALYPGFLKARVSLADRRFFFDWDWAGTEREFRELGADPQMLLGGELRPIALSLWARGRAEEAVSLMERALRVDPENLTSKIVMGDYLAQAGRLDEAIAVYKTAIEADSSDPRPQFGLAAEYASDRNLTLGLNLKFGPQFVTLSNTGAQLAFTAQVVVGYRM